MNESEKDYTNNPDAKDYILYDWVYMKFSEKLSL